MKVWEKLVMRRLHNLTTRLSNTGDIRLKCREKELITPSDNERLKQEKDRCKHNEHLLEAICANSPSRFPDFVGVLASISGGKKYADLVERFQREYLQLTGEQLKIRY